jgi:hypothetical protein
MTNQPQPGSLIDTNLTGTERVAIDTGGAYSAVTTTAAILQLAALIGILNAKLTSPSISNPLFTGTIDGVNLLLTGTAVINGTLTVGIAIETVPTTFANLPIIPASYGARAFITDSTTGQFGAIVSGGGDYRVPVYWDNGPSVWRVG